MLRDFSRLWKSRKLIRRFATTSLTRQAAVVGANENALQPWPAAIHLRQYQEECIQAVLSNLAQGRKRLGISLATGSGKTVIFTRLIDRIPSLGLHGDRTLVLAHRRELVEQAVNHCGSAYPSKSIDVEMGETQASGVADITVASVRSLISGDRLQKYDPARFKLVLVDEAHHIVAPSYMQILKHFGLDTLRAGSPALVGVSATLSRFDGLKLGTAIDHIVYHKDYIEMIDEKWLTDVVFTTVRSKADLSTVKSSSAGDFVTAQLSRAVNTPPNNEITFQAWQLQASGRKSTLVFCVDVDHITDLTKVFLQHGVDARFITGMTKKHVRGERLEAFKNGQFPVLLNCGVFTEGTDIPNVDCVLLARPTKSRNLLMQMLGRGMRLYPGKANCHVIDMVASLATGIVSVPTLFGLDPSELVDHATPQEMQELKEKRDGEQQESEAYKRLYPSADVTGYSLVTTHYDTVHDLVDDTSGERHIRALSSNAWVQTAEAKYVLSSKNGVLTIQLEDAIESIAGDARSSPESPKFQVVYKRPIPKNGTTPSGQAKSKSPYARPRVIASNMSAFSDAVHAADTFAASVFVRVFISHRAAWRQQPASEGQLATIKKIWAKSGGVARTNDSNDSNDSNDVDEAVIRTQEQPDQRHHLPRDHEITDHEDDTENTHLHRDFSSNPEDIKEQQSQTTVLTDDPTTPIASPKNPPSSHFQHHPTTTSSSSSSPSPSSPSSRSSLSKQPPTPTTTKTMTPASSSSSSFPTDLTKGQATDMLTKFKHGVRGWFDNMKLVERQQKQKQKKKQQQQY